MSNTNSLKALIKNIADAIRNRTSKAATMSIEEMPNEIASIQGPYPTQSKSVNVKKNGEVVVTPDEGYVLDKVTANVDVATTSDNNAKIVADSTMQYAGLNYGLENIDLSGWDTSNVQSFAELFYMCKKIKDIDVSNFNTSKADSMRAMFEGCYELKNIEGLSSFDTSKVTNMSSMFYGCHVLTSLDLSSFDTSKVTNMSSMFYGCHVLTSLDLSSFDTSKVTDMGYMFGECNGLTSLDLSSFDTSKVTRMGYMFFGGYQSYQFIPIKTLTLSPNWASSEKIDSFDLSKCWNLTHDSTLDIFNKLATRTNSPTLRLYSYTKKLMTEEEIAIATNKGWVVS